MTNALVAMTLGVLTGTPRLYAKELVAVALQASDVRGMHLGWGVQPRRRKEPGTLGKGKSHRSHSHVRAARPTAQGVL